MQLAVEISLYPLDQDYIPYIREFIERLNANEQLMVKTSHTSTLVSGEYSYVMEVMYTEMKTTFEQVGQAIFVCKFLNATNMNLD